MAAKKSVPVTTSTLYTEVEHPKLIKAVVKELKNHDAKLILAKLEDLEKAIYHIAVKQQDMLLQQQQIEKVVVGTSTAVEEMMNGFEMVAEESMQEEDLPVDVWGSTNKKNVSRTNN
jgi:hypothetical protein